MLVLLIGAGWDLARLTRARPAPPPASAPAVVPEPVQEPDPVDAPTPVAVTPSPVLLDINRASAQELDRLPGIGPVLASRIVAHRERHGPFRDPTELLAVPGIGPALAARLVPLVTVSVAPRR